jgi:hypothetical protein
MNWFDQMLQGFGVPNIAGEQNKALANNPTVQAARGPNGSFDTTRLGASLGAENQDGLDFISQLYGMQGDAMKQATQPPTRTGVQWLGDALSAASVPVAFAQGNEGYGLKMTGNTGSDKFNERVRTYEDEARKAQMNLAGDMTKSYGDYGLDVLKGKREKAAEGRKTLAGILSAGRREDGSLDDAALADAESYASMNGLQREWEEIKKALPKSMPTASQPAAQPAANSQPLSPGLAGLSNMATNLPGASAPPAEARFEPSPQVQDAIRKAQRVAAVDPERGKLMMDLAKDEYKTELNVFEAKQKSLMDARSGAYSTSNTAQFRHRKTGEMRPGQYGSKGGVKISDVLDAKGNPVVDPNFNPNDWEYVGPAEVAGMKASMTAQGTSQGTAAAGIPKLEADYSMMADLLTDIETHPALENLTGNYGPLWADQIPNAPWGETGDAEALIKNVNSKAFLMAFESLKGAGAITEAEGKAATEALTRLQNMRVTDKAYKRALSDFRDTINKLRKQAYEKAQSGFTLPGYAVQPSAQPVPPPQGGGKFSGMSDEEFLKSRSGGR